MIDEGLRAVGWRSRPTTADRLGAVAPIPFVGVAVILVALIVFTPVLLANGPSPLAVRAELYVYRVVGARATEFDVHAYDSEVPYRWLNVSVGTGFAWDGGCPTTPLAWSYHNGTNVIVSSALTNVTSAVVNVTAVYVSDGSRTVYAGEIAFNVTNLGSSSETLAYAPCPSTPGLGGSGTWLVSLGTAVFPLVDYGAGGPP